MNCLVLNGPSSTPISLSLRLISSCFEPKAIPARDIVIDFGKHKGKMLGTLPSNHLRWVSKNLRGREFEQWANLAGQVLQDPVYQDRIEWEFADNVLQGNINNAKVTRRSAVSMLLEISERFGWDNEDKDGWSKVKFELLGTSKGGRIPRILDNDNGVDKKQVKRLRVKAEDDDKRKERRERRRLRLKREEEKKKKNGVTVRLKRTSQGFDDKVEIYNPFPGREALLNNLLNRHLQN
ncbi:hypothetical protein PTKIN_Ptkin18bG0022900 [Pterospermum kingtungense]